MYFDGLIINYRSVEEGQHILDTPDPKGAADKTYIDMPRSGEVLGCKIKSGDAVFTPSVVDRS